MKKVIVTILPDLIRDISKIVRFSCVMAGLWVMTLLCMVSCRPTTTSTPVNSQQSRITTDPDYGVNMIYSIARYQNRHTTAFEMTVLDSLSATEIGSFGDGGRYADFLAPSTFASVQLLKLQVDSILSLLNHHEIDSAAIFYGYLDAHYDEIIGRKKK